MNPYLDPQNNPHLKIEVLLSSWTTADCLIDTGFSGGVALPEHFLAGFSKKPIKRKTSRHSSLPKRGGPSPLSRNPTWQRKIRDFFDLQIRDVV